MIPLSVPNLNGNEMKYVQEAIQEAWVSTSGAYVTRFEKELAQYLKIEEGVACQSGTAALHLALILSGVGVGDEVIVPTLTFIAAVNPVKYLGAEPIFMDCDDTLNMDCDKLERFLQVECEYTTAGLLNKKTKRKIKALVIVHVFGNMANMERIMALAQKYTLKVVEDATEALGTYYTEGKYRGEFAGTIGDFGAYSFNGNKIITTGGGGFLVGKEVELVKKARYLATQAKDDELYYRHDAIGFNYRMTNLQAALGVAQLENLEHMISTKRSNYEYYKQGLILCPQYTLLGFNSRARNNYWFYTLLIQDTDLKREVVLQLLKEKGVQARPIWQLIHTQKPYQGHHYYAMEKAPYYLERAINIPCSTTLKKEEIDYVLSVLGAIGN